MIFYIKEIVKVGGKEQGYRDVEIETSQLTIGRGTDQDLQLADERVAFSHAEISQVDGNIQLRSLAATSAKVNGRPSRTAFLTEGDQILLGNYLLVVIPAPADNIDLALSIEKLELPERRELEESRFRTRPGALPWLRKRRWALGLFVMVLLFGLALPGMVAWQSERAEERRALPLPDDHLWLSGELSRAHEFIGHECESCHQKPFQRVRDDACLECHTDVAHHYPEGHGHTEINANCASCHREHNGESGLILDDQRFCVNCHEDLNAVAPLTRLRDVSDFGRAHPDFRVRLMQPELDDEGIRWHLSERLEITPELRDEGQLIYDHEVHLDPDGIENELGRKEVLACTDCHEPAGRGIQPVRMEPHCSRCHSLAFDEDRPDRTVPHGDVDQVIDRLDEYFSRRFLDEQAASSGGEVRRPGHDDTRAALRDEGIEWVRERTEQAARDLFERRVCVTCHEVSQHDRPREDGLPDWFVMPVKVTQGEWFGGARFSHEHHRNSECTVCHAAAEDSTDAGDILMPEISVCRDCHTGEKGKQGLQSTCITCHGFHIYHRDDNQRGLHE